MLDPLVVRAALRSDGSSLSIPETEIREAVLSIKARAKAVHDAMGGDIARDWPFCSDARRAAHE